MLRLNLGSHGENYPGYVNVDLFDVTADLKADVSNLPYEDGTVDECLAWHLLEHFRATNEYEPHLSNSINPKTCEEVLREWYRVLRIGGKLSIKCPDFEKIVILFYKFPQWARAAGPGGIFPNYTFWLCSIGQHQAVFDRDTMIKLLNKVGFTKIDFLDPPLTGNPDRSNLEMYVEAIKI